MDKHTAQNIAKHLMVEHGLSDWSFVWIKAPLKFGNTSYRKREIQLSEPLTLLNDVIEVTDTIKHEIAHALCPNDRHGKLWQAKCLEIGARPQATYSSDNVILPEPTHRLECSNCSAVTDFYAKPRQVYSCVECCNKHNGGKFSYEFVLTLMVRNPETESETEMAVKKKKIGGYRKGSGFSSNPESAALQLEALARGRQRSVEVNTKKGVKHRTNISFPNEQIEAEFKALDTVDRGKLVTKHKAALKKMALDAKVRKASKTTRIYEVTVEGKKRIGKFEIANKEAFDAFVQASLSQRSEVLAPDTEGGAWWAQSDAITGELLEGTPTASKTVRLIFRSQGTVDEFAKLNGWEKGVFIQNCLSANSPDPDDIAQGTA